MTFPVANATGLNPDDFPPDAEVDPDLLQQLANQQLTPGDIEIYHDEETGRSFIRSRNKFISDAMGGVEKGHLYQSAKSKYGIRNVVVCLEFVLVNTNVYMRVWKQRTNNVTTVIPTHLAVH